MNPTTPKTEPLASTRFRTAVFSGARQQTFSALRLFISASLIAAGLFGVSLLPPSVSGWERVEHSQLTAAAVAALAAKDQQTLAPEAAALAREYCMFPDHNWAGYGEWGSGEADPRKPRFPDTRREWDISFYLGFNPVTREGKGYVHRPPESYEAVPLYYGKALEALQAGQLADGARYLGVTLHYLQDSGAFGHLQPIHRPFHWQPSAEVRADGYQPRLLGQTPQAAAEGLRARLQGLVGMTEQRVAPLLERAGLPLAEVKRLCATELMPERAVRAVAQVRAAWAEEWEAAVRACALECVRVSADALHTALAFAPQPFPATPLNAAGVNLVFNPSFEEAGDGVPLGWCVGWLDLNDRAGRAEWYLAGTHWDRPVRSGQRSAHMRWAPQSGLEWRQTWRQAVRVQPGESYRGAAWVKTRTDSGSAAVLLEFYNAAYLAVGRLSSPPLAGDHEWRQLSIESTVPPDARWLRLILHSTADGAAWFDDAEVMRLPPTRRK